MPIATNPQTGETVFLAEDGSWQRAQTAVNPQTNETIAFDGKDWTPVRPASKGGSALDNALKPITSYPETYNRMQRESRDQIGRGVGQLGSGDAWEMAKGAGNVALGGIGYVASPINAAIDTVVGQPIQANTGIPAEYTDFAATLALPIPKRIPSLRPGPSAVAPPTRELGVTLSEGQATQDLSTIQREQAALRSASGGLPQKAAQAFTDQQQAELAAARGNISTQLDPGRQVLADSPQAAAELAQQGIRQTAAVRKAGVRAAYDEAKSYPGEIHADAFEGIGQRIKGDLSAGENPVVIDDKLTPYAAQMIRDVEDRVAHLRIQNRADPLGQPNPESIVGVDLRGVDQMRRRLSTFRKDAYASGNAADGRAAQGVLDAFDGQIDAAVNGGLFRGDPRAVDAWNNARAAYSDFRSTFTAGKNDPVGRVVEKIIGKRDNPAAIPNDVADFLYGSAGTNPSSLNVGVAKRVQSILGDRSPEWSAVKQGLFERLVNAGEGMTPFGPGKVAQRINRYLNVDGKEMAGVLFSNPERDLLQSYADLMRKLEIPQAGANWSNTSTFVGQAYKPSAGMRVLNAVGSNVGTVVSAVLGYAGHTALSGLTMPGAAEAGAAAMAKVTGYSAQAMEARKIARMMPVISKLAVNYKMAAQEFEASQSARSAARLVLVSKNLSTNLKDIGVNFSPEQLLRAMQGPGPGSAQDEQR